MGAIHQLTLADMAPGGGGSSTLNTGIVSYWKLEELTSTRVDELGTNNLTSTGAGLINGTGMVGNAAQFDGTNFLHKADNASLTFGTAMSVSFGLYQLSVANNKGVAGQWNYGVDGVWQIQTTNGGADLIMWTLATPTDAGGNDGHTTTASMANTTFYHWVFVYDGTQTGDSNRLKAYLNGSNIALSFTGTIPATLLDGTTDLNVGSFEGLPRVLSTGDRVDELALWSRALSAGEVTELYNSGTPKQYPF